MPRPHNQPSSAIARDWQRTAVHLVVATMAYNVVEAAVGIGAGLSADSIALLGFGLDSVIETAAAGLVLWRLSIETKGADRHTVERTERRVLQFVGSSSASRFSCWPCMSSRRRRWRCGGGPARQEPRGNPARRGVVGHHALGGLGKTPGRW